DPGPYRTKMSEEAEAEYVRIIQACEAELVVLAGFMRIIKVQFLNAFPGKVINLHPSLLPSFPGLNAIRQAYEYGVKVTGCTVHRVTAELDAGPLLDQAVVRIDPSDSLAAVEQKVLAA